MPKIGDQIAKGASWMLFFKIVEQSLGLISTIILARLLFPADFGLVAMAMSIIAALELLSAFSFDMALIQNQKSERKHYDTAWTFNVLFALTSCILLVSLAMPAAIFYKEPRLELVMYVLAIGYLIQGFENIGVVNFRKDMQFNKEFTFLLGKKLAGFLVTIPLAYFIQSYWALIAGMVMGRGVGVGMSYYLHAYRPRFSLQARRELFGFSKWMLINNALSFFRLRFVDFIIGRTSGTQALGLYNVAFEISNMPTSHLVAPINRAVYPGYAKIAHDTAALRENFLNVIAIITIFALPIGVGIAAVSDPLVKVVLGDRWLEAILIIKILSFYGALTSIQTNIGYTYIATKNLKLMTGLSLLYIAILLPLVSIYAVEYGALGAAWSYVITAVVMMPIYYFSAMRTMHIKISQLLLTFWRPVASASVMYFSVFYLYQYLADNAPIDSDALLLIIGVLTGMFSFIGTLLALWLLSSKPNGAESIVLDKITSWLSRKKKTTQ